MPAQSPFENIVKTAITQAYNTCPVSVELLLIVPAIGAKFPDRPLVLCLLAIIIPRNRSGVPNGT